jgi:hypothetical protein
LCNLFVKEVGGSILSTTSKLFRLHLHSSLNSNTILFTPFRITTGIPAPASNQNPHHNSKIRVFHTHQHYTGSWRNAYPQETQGMHDNKHVQDISWIKNLEKGCQHNSVLTIGHGLLVPYNLNLTCSSFNPPLFMTLPSNEC